MGITLFLITLVALLIIGHYQAKKSNTVLLDEGFIPYSNTEPYLITDPYKGLKDYNPVFYKGEMTPKEYGIRYCNGKSRVKKSNRLNFKR